MAVVDIVSVARLETTACLVGMEDLVQARPEGKSGLDDSRADETSFSQRLLRVTTSYEVEAARIQNLLLCYAVEAV